MLRLLAAGHTATAIARRLGISPRTVHQHLAHLYRKLSVNDRLRAVQAAEDLGLLDRHHGLAATTPTSDLTLESRAADGHEVQIVAWRPAAQPPTLIERQMRAAR